MRINFFIFLFVFIFPFISLAALDENEFGTRTKGMGNAFTGIADDISAVGFNPAGLGQFQKSEVFLMYNNAYSLDLLKNFGLSIASPGIAGGTLGFSYHRTGLGASANFLGSYSENVYILSYGVEVLPLLYLGANLKYMKVNYDISATAIGLDLGLLFRIFEKHLSLGLMAKNANSPVIRWDNSTKEDLSPVLRVGAGLRPNNQLLFGFDIDRINEENYNIHTGGEVWLLQRMLSPRIGIGYLQSDGIVFDTGFSLLYRTFRLDYTFENHYELGMNHIFGILIKY